MAQQTTYSRRRISIGNIGHHLLGEDGSLELLPVPVHRIFLSDALLRADRRLAVLPARNSVAWALEDDIDVHTVDTDVPIVLEAEIDVLLDAEAEVAGA